MLINNSNEENKSIIHKLNPTIKFILVLFFITIILISKTFFVLLIIFAVVITIFFVSKISIKSFFKRLGYIFILFLFLFLINWISYKDPIAIFTRNFSTIGFVDNEYIVSKYFGGSIWDRIQMDLLIRNNTFPGMDKYLANLEEKGLLFSSLDILGGDTEYNRKLLYVLNNNFTINNIYYQHKIFDNLLLENNIVTNWGEVIFYTSNWYSLSPKAIILATYVSVRIFLILLCSTIFIATTNNIQITRGIEGFLSPLKYLKIPTNEISMILSMSITFIPVLYYESKKILQAQASRGSDFGSKNIIIKIKSLTSLIIPLFVSIFQKSEDISNAMETRGYIPRNKRTKYITYKVKYYDFISLSLTLLLFTFALITNIMNVYFSYFNIWDAVLLG